MSIAVAKNLMAEMKLLGMLSAFDKVVADATRDLSSYSELLDTLLQAEAGYREERKTGYGVKVTKFTLRPAIEDIDFTASRLITKAQVKGLYGLQWLHDARPVLLIGQTGVGKTFLSPGCGAAYLRLRQVCAVHDADHLGGEPGTGALQRHESALPRRARQARPGHYRRLRDAKAVIHRGAGSV